MIEIKQVKGGEEQWKFLAADGSLIEEITTDHEAVVGVGKPAKRQGFLSLSYNRPFCVDWFAVSANRRILYDGAYWTAYTSLQIDPVGSFSTLPEAVYAAVRELREQLGIVLNLDATTEEVDGCWVFNDEFLVPSDYQSLADVRMLAGKALAELNESFTE